MPTATQAAAPRVAGGPISVNGLRIEMIERGQGRPLLFLHPGIGIDPKAPVLDALAAKARLIAPSHPGFGTSELAPTMTTVEDLSYFYLDLMEALDLDDAIVVGIGFGAWIAAATAVKSTARIARLVLANAVGIKVGDRETRDIVDIFALLDPELDKLAYADPRPASATTRACRWPRSPSRRATARRSPASPGNRTCTTPSSRAGCTASASRRCFSGAGRTAS